MPHDLLFALILFAAVGSITPGPNNIMLLTSGANFGWRASLPHLLGICVGFPVLLLAVGLGLAETFVRVPASAVVLKWLGAAYLLYLAWRIANAAAPQGQANRPARPMSFWEAVAFQWINPKAWMMAASAFSAYVPPGGGWLAIGAVAAIFAVFGTPCVAAWMLFGTGMRRFLAMGSRARMFNLTMALLLVVSLVPLFA